MPIDPVVETRTIEGHRFELSDAGGDGLGGYGSYQRKRFGMWHYPVGAAGAGVCESSFRSAAQAWRYAAEHRALFAASGNCHGWVVVRLPAGQLSHYGSLAKPTKTLCGRVLPAGAAHCRQDAPLRSDPGPVGCHSCKLKFGHYRLS
jgi:hypothetical protein